jgi:transposase InsO family protein
MEERTESQAGTIPRGNGLGDEAPAEETESARRGGETELALEEGEAPVALEAAPTPISTIVACSEARPTGEEVAREVASPRRRRGKRLVSPGAKSRRGLTGEQRLLMLDAWQRSGLPAKDFAALVGVSPHTLYAWRKRFSEHGPAGLMDKPKGGPKGSRLPEVTKRSILMLKSGNPEYGTERISDLLARGPGLGASPNAVARVLKEAGYELEEVKTSPHRDKKRRFERAKPGELWQTDLFTFVLKRQNRRVYLVAFLDDHSRFVVGFGLHASASTELVLEVLRSAITSYGVPTEILTDNGPQYVSWRGKSKFTKELEKHGIKQVVARPKRPQTLGKAERLWGTLWRECVERAVFLDLEDARRRVAFFFDHYNFHRPHRGIGGLVPADRLFSAAPEVLAMLQSRVAANALELARSGVPKQPFYLTGQVGGKQFSVHAAGERVYLSRPDAERAEIELVAPGEQELVDAESADAEPGHEVSTGSTSPTPVTPAGPAAAVEQALEHERAPAPGASVLDDALAVPWENLASSRTEAEPVAPESAPSTALPAPSTSDDAPEVDDE